MDAADRFICWGVDPFGPTDERNVRFLYARDKPQGKGIPSKPDQGSLELFPMTADRAADCLYGLSGSRI